MSPAPGARLGPYEIVAPLGQGGMGEVFRARDTRLDRAVALKVLPRHLADDPTARARFEREAKAIAGLNHPNVCALYDVGHDQGQDFLVMELLEGMTLQERLLRGPLDVVQLVDTSVALADALDAAHTHGLIHRDLKPANIFLTTRGIPKVLDFGLAKALDPSDDATRQSDAVLTGLGTTIGTVAYMSPEQLRGEPLDARTDLFSLGLVFYEMATGQRAFTGPTSAVISAGILGQDAAAPRTIRPDLPPRLEDAILKLLEKDRALRCQSAADLRADLMRLKREASDVTRTVAAAATTAPMPMAAAPSPSGPGAAGAVPAAAASHRARPQRRSSRVPVLIGVSVLLPIAGSAAAYWFSHRPSAAPSSSPPAQSAPPTTVPPPNPAPAPAPPPPPAQQISTPPVATPTSSPGIPPTTDRGATSLTGQPATITTPPAGTTPTNTQTSRAASTTTTDAGAGRNNVRPNAGRGRAGRGRIGPAAGNTLVSRLRALPPQPFHIVFAAGQPEARELAMELQTLLNAAGWTSSGVQPTQEAAAPGYLGVGVPHQTVAATTLVTWATNNGLNPDYRILQRLKEIHIVIGPPK